MTGRTRPWGDFKRWCHARGLKSLPAHPWTVSAYLRFKERRKDAAAAHAALAAISREHLLKSGRALEKHPLVLRTLATIDLRDAIRSQRSNLFDLGEPLAEPAKTGPEAAKKARRRALSQSPKLVSRRPNN